MCSSLVLKEWLSKLTKLRKNSGTPALDARLLLQFVSQKKHAWLIANQESMLQKDCLVKLEALLPDFSQGMPMAYLLGQQEFWSLPLKVTVDTLVPRADTECLVEWVLEKFPSEKCLQVLDLGTGSGAIALALKSEKNNWSIAATDQSEQALAVAKKNSTELQLDVEYALGSWWQPLKSRRFDCIVSNPPYIEEGDSHLSALQYEPKSALTAGKEGLSDLTVIIQGAHDHLQDNGWLIVEHGYNQQKQVLNLFQSAGFDSVQGHQDLSGQDRFVVGKRQA